MNQKARNKIGGVKAFPAKANQKQIRNNMFIKRKFYLKSCRRRYNLVVIKRCTLLLDDDYFPCTGKASILVSFAIVYFRLPINLIYMYRGHHSVICISFTRQGFPFAVINIKYGRALMDTFLKNAILQYNPCST